MNQPQSSLFANGPLPVDRASGSSARPTILRKQPSTRSDLRLTSARSGISTLAVISTLMVVTLCCGGLWLWLAGPKEAARIEPITVKVTRDEFVSRVLDQGEIQSSENVEIRCDVRQRNGSLVVIDAIPEGTLVEAGDFLIQLGSTNFETELEQQKIALANNETKVIQAETELATARASKLEYEQGTYVESHKTIENEIFDAESAIQTALQELSQAKAVMEHSKKLQARGFITRQQLIADEFSVQKAVIARDKGVNSEDLARKKLSVLENITRAKEQVRLESDIRSAQVNLASQQEAFSVEKTKLKTIKKQIAKCNIRVPEGVSGQVVYAQERNRGNDWVLEKGTTVRENQVLIRIPDPEQMEVKALVNEQSITQVRPGMPVEIKVDALNSTKLIGVVTKVNQYAESGGWMRSSVRKYGVLIRIVDPPLALKPGMNASVSIQTNFQKDALLAPLQTVYGLQNQQFCLAKTDGNQFKTLEVTIAGDNSEMVMFASGVEEGTELVMNPGAYKDYMDLPEISRDRPIEIPEGREPTEERSRMPVSQQPAATDQAQPSEPSQDRSAKVAPGNQQQPEVSANNARVKNNARVEPNSGGTGS